MPQGGRRSSDLDVGSFCYTKNFQFFEYYDVSAWTGGRSEAMRTCCGQLRGLIFGDFVYTSFMDGP